MIKMSYKGENLRFTAETVGIFLGVIAAGIVSILVSGFVIHWILGAIGLGSPTYGQIVGILAIWEIIKPTSGSKS